MCSNVYSSVGRILRWREYWRWHMSFALYKCKSLITDLRCKRNTKAICRLAHCLSLVCILWEPWLLSLRRCNFELGLLTLIQKDSWTSFEFSDSQHVHFYLNTLLIDIRDQTRSLLDGLKTTSYPPSKKGPITSVPALPVDQPPAIIAPYYSEPTARYFHLHKHAISWLQLLVHNRFLWAEMSQQRDFLEACSSMKRIPNARLPRFMSLWNNVLFLGG